MMSTDMLNNNLRHKVKLKSEEFLKKYENFRDISIFHEINISDKGKQLRGTLVLLAYKSNSNEINEEAYDLAVVMEFLHSAFLVQDDVIDKDSTRRQQQTIHKQLEIKYGNKAPSDCSAYMIGTFCISYAIQLFFDVINKMSYHNKKYKKIEEIFFEILLDTIQGEGYDMYFPIHDIGKYGKIEENREEIALGTSALKTAAYTFELPIRIGHILSGGRDSEEWFHSFGNALGIAFQMTNDLKALKKIEQYKKDECNLNMIDIYPYRITIANAIAFRENADLLNEVISLNSPLSDEDMASHLQNIQNNYPYDLVKKELEKQIKKYLKKSEELLERDECPFNENGKTALKNYIEDLFRKEISDVQL